MTRENHLTNGPKVRELDTRYDYKISTPEIERLLARLEQIKAVARAGMGDEEKKAMRDDLSEILDKLDEAAAEREDVLKILKEDPDTIHTNSFGSVQYIPKLQNIISQIDAATEEYYEYPDTGQVEEPEKTVRDVEEETSEPVDGEDAAPDTKQPANNNEKPELNPVEVPAGKTDPVKKEEVENPEPSKSKTKPATEKKNIFTTISPEIRAYLAALENGTTEGLIEEIGSFIKKQTKRIAKRRSEIQDTSSREYQTIEFALLQLSDLGEKIKEKKTPKSLQDLSPVQRLFMPGTINKDTIEEGLKKQEALSPEERAKAGAEAKAKYRPIDLDMTLSPDNREHLEKNQDLYGRLKTAVNTYNEKIAAKGDESAIKDAFDEITTLQREFIEYRDSKNRIDYKRISLGDPADPFYVSPENKMIMENSGFIIQMAEAVNKYNALIDKGADIKSVEEAFRKVDFTRKEFDRRNGPEARKLEPTKPPKGKKLAVHEVRDGYFEYVDRAGYVDKHSKKDHPEYKARTAARTYNDSDFSEGEDVIDRYAEKHGKNPKKSKRIKLQAKPAAKTAPVPVSSHTPNPESRIFTMEEGVDYSDLAEDVKFNAWLKNMAEAIERRGIPVKTQEQDLEDWYDEYEDSLQYENKLRAMQEDIKKTEGKNPITVLMTEKKIGDLLFEIHMHGDVAREKIDALFEEFEASQTKAAEIKKLKETKEFLDLVEQQRKGNKGKNNGLSIEQVKAILEIGGEVNARETIEEMVEFLEDIALNYDFYNKSAEDTHDNMYRLYKRHAASEGLHGGKIRWYQKLVPKFFSRMPSSIDQNDFNNFETIIYKIRELDLVSKKTDGRDEAMAKKTKMAKLVRFCKGQESLLAKHMTDPKSNKEGEFEDDEEGKELLKIFDKLVKTFANSKYRGEEARERAEEMLKKMTGPSKQKIEDLAPTADIFFDDATEVEILRREATRDLTRGSLSRMEADLNRYMKTGVASKDLVEINTKFDAIETTLKAYGDGDKDKLATGKMRLRLDELMIKYLKKDTYKELSGAFPALDRIIQSPDKKPDEKKAYITELLTSLKKHETNSSNTMVQKAVIGDTIKKYTTILSTIK